MMTGRAGTKLLNGFRGAPPVDIVAVVATTRAVGRLMLARPEIVEIDINPFVAFATGAGGPPSQFPAPTRFGELQ